MAGADGGPGNFGAKPYKFVETGVQQNYFVRFVYRGVIHCFLFFKFF
jgi:hypothetical protein